MEQKRVSFKVAKAIKKAGYPQMGQYRTQEDDVYVFEGDKWHLLSSCDIDFTDVEYIYVPTYLDVWLWLWREKKFSIDVDCYNCDKWTTDINGIEFNDPEEAIAAAIEYLVDNDLLK